MGDHTTPDCRSVREAARGGDLQRVGRLLSLGGGVCSSAANTKGNTALHFAAESGRVDIVQLLLLKGADKNAVNWKQCSPLHNAAENGHVTSVEALLAAGANASLRAGRDECSILDFAVIRGDMDILRGKMLEIREYVLTTSDHLVFPSSSVYYVVTCAM